MNNRDLIEKTRINNRPGHETRNIDVKQLLYSSDPNSDIFCPENQRFDKDFSQYYKKQRYEDIKKREEILENKRIRALNREHNKLNNYDIEFQNKETFISNKREFLKEKGTYSNGMAYNPITLKYHESKQGNMLKEKDEYKDFRAKLRSKNLDLKANTSFNILTGEDRKGVDVPLEVFKQAAKDLFVPRKKETRLY